MKLYVLPFSLGAALVSAAALQCAPDGGQCNLLAGVPCCTGSSKCSILFGPGTCFSTCAALDKTCFPGVAGLLARKCCSESDLVCKIAPGNTQGSCINKPNNCTYTRGDQCDGDTAKQCCSLDGSLHWGLEKMPRLPRTAAALTRHGVVFEFQCLWPRFLF
ncbi:hypothetical protein DFH06DRAFT_1332741 [Mycena polygramma]|nr:hypothetical protein DFH06DRAFT_1332741 [Mycena polygramma]